MTEHRHFRGARANRKGTTCGNVRRWQHKPCTWPSYSRTLQLHSLLKRWPVYILAAAHFTYPAGMESWVEIVCSGDWIRTSCTHEWTCVGAPGVANDLTNWASQTWEWRWSERLRISLASIHFHAARVRRVYIWETTQRVWFSNEHHRFHIRFVSVNRNFFNVESIDRCRNISISK